ncbi:MAG: IS5 family transposase, partial [Minisyncoccales bacterium]
VKMKKRDWRKVNRKYIKQGEFLVNPSFLDSWVDEIKEMNKKKVGEPFHYPPSMIEFISYFHCYGFGYRQCEGILRGILKSQNEKLPVMSYSQISRRVNTFEVSFNRTKEEVVVGIDGTGEKVSNRGEWIRQKWGKRRDWIKVVIMGNDNGEIVDIRIGNSKLEERKAARGMLRKNPNIDKVLMDGLHDCKKTFNLCEDKNIETGIKIRKGSRTRSKGSPRRRREVKEYQSMEHKDWVNKKGYGDRWPSSEGIFSAKKRIFGEHVRATKKKNMYKEVFLKYWAYNQLQKV